ncbi:hypothetical protein ACWCXB_22665 [Streptomyces sp. NPDC001514]
MTQHFTDTVLAQLARSGPDDPRHRRHLADCAGCRTRLAAWQHIGTAMRQEAAEQAVSVPSFDALLGPALSAEPAGAAAPAPAGSPLSAAFPRRVARPWRTAGQLALRQVRLMPKVWAPLSAAGLVGAALLASAQVQDRFGLRLFGGVAVLLVMLGGLMVASPRRDPRHEVLFTLPVPPAAVFLARLTVVLCVDVALAMVCSALVDGPGWWAVVSSWLGKSLLAASLALSLSVRCAPVVGTAAGGALWLLSVVSGPQGMLSTPFDPLLDALLSTTPWALLLAVALLGWAAGAMRSAGNSPSA